MNNADLGLTGFGFWLAIALIVIAIIWAVVRFRQMKHELTLKLLERGQDIDPQLLANLLASDRTAVAAPQKTGAELHRDQGGFTGFLLVAAGLVFALISMLRGSGLSWPLLGLGAFTFLFGWLTWHRTHQEYLREKAEEQQLRG